MKYTIRIEETLSREIEVDAKNMNDAKEQVEAKYRAERIILNADDYCNTQFYVKPLFAAQ